MYMFMYIHAYMQHKLSSPQLKLTYLMHVRDCQFQIRMVWSSDALITQGYSCRREDVYTCTVHAYVCCIPYIHVYMYMYLVEEGGADIVQVAQESKEAALLFVVPDL